MNKKDTVKYLTDLIETTDDDFIYSGPIGFRGQNFDEAPFKINLKENTDLCLIRHNKLILFGLAVGKEWYKIKIYIVDPNHVPAGTNMSIDIISEELVRSIKSRQAKIITDADELMLKNLKTFIEG